MQAIEIKAKETIPQNHSTISHPKYPIHLGLGLLRYAGALIQERSGAKRLAVIADEQAMACHGEVLFAALSEQFFISALVLPSGEAQKTPETVQRVVEFLAAAELTREDALVAFGGGVTGDIGGFAASIYLRGIDYIHIPTTLLAQVDSSIGGKVGVNLARGKNLMGAFHDPVMVLTDPSVLATLSPEDWQCGISELVKYGFTLAPSLLEQIPEGDAAKAPENWLAAIETAIRLKVSVVAKDPRESDLRKVLNFGHTIGHGLERLEGFGHISHGQAVAQGMLVETMYASRHFGTSPQLLDQLERTLMAYGLAAPSQTAALRTADWETALRTDKKQSGGDLVCPIPLSCGSWELRKVDLKSLARFAQEVLS